jgi:hypothetical protein
MTADVLSYCQHLVNVPRLRCSTTNQRLQAIRCLCRWAERQGFLKSQSSSGSEIVARHQAPATHWFDRTRSSRLTPSRRRVEAGPRQTRLRSAAIVTANQPAVGRAHQLETGRCPDSGSFRGGASAGRQRQKRTRGPPQRLRPAAPRAEPAQPRPKPASVRSVS